MLKSISSNPPCLHDASGRNADWQIFTRDGPVIATAIHDGHRIRDSLLPYLEIEDEDRLREEDPLTAILISAGDSILRMRTSRFEFDVNRAREKAVPKDPADTWGLRIWRDTLPDDEVRQSLARYDSFYSAARHMLDRLLQKWGCLLVLDIHSYNHRRNGSARPPGGQIGNPDIDLGVTTLDTDRWGDVVRVFEQKLSRSKVGGRYPDVRRNVRYAGGGFFPEWIHGRYGKDICTISLEYKKIFMDEWSGKADVELIDDFRCGLEDAVTAVRSRFGVHS